MIRNKELISNVQFCTALLDKRKVVVYMDDEEIGKGTIETVTESSIKINNEYYMRSGCTFLFHNIV